MHRLIVSVLPRISWIAGLLVHGLWMTTLVAMRVVLRVLAIGLGPVLLLIRSIIVTHYEYRSIGISRVETEKSVIVNQVNF